MEFACAGLVVSKSFFQSFAHFVLEVVAKLQSAVVPNDSFFDQFRPQMRKIAISLLAFAA